MIALFILIYLVSLVIHLVMCYKEYKYAIYKVGDLLDLTEFHMWFPILNTLHILAVIIGVTVSKLGIFWEKFRNIKLK